jgi:protein SCO1/2
MNWKNCAAGIAVSALLAGAGAARGHGGASHAQDAAQAPSPTGAANRWGANYFPNVPLTTQDGRTVRFYDDLIKGKSVAINFMYTECTEVCPLETASLVRAYRLLGERAGRDVVFYSISMDPKRDTPAVLKAYAAKFGADWLFLTGKPDDIRLLGKKLGMLRERDAATNSHHAAQLLLGDESNGQWQRNSAVDNPEFLTARMATFFGWREVAPAKSYADARPVVAPNGQRLFQSKCSSCHSFGQGDRVGPDLAGITARRTRAWVTRYIAEPDALLAAGDPIATELFKRYKEVRMPNLRLGSSDVADLVSFLNAQDVSTSGRASHATPAARPDGSARR